MASNLRLVLGTSEFGRRRLAETASVREMTAVENFT